MKVIVIGGIVILAILTFFMVCICIKYDDKSLSDEEVKE